MTILLHQCAGCNVPFTMQDFEHLIAVAPKTKSTGTFQRAKDTLVTLISRPDSQDVNPDSLVFTCCKPLDTIAIHVFYKTCLSSWVSQSKQNCPTCRAPVYKHQLGKAVTQLLAIFLDALQHDQQIVTETLLPYDRQNGECPICCNDLAIIPLRFDPQTSQLYHEKCGAAHPQLYIPDLATIASKIINKTPHLKELYTPVPPTFLEKLVQDYPLAARITFFGAITVGSFVLNRNKFGGNNWPLFILGFPVYLTLIGVHQIGLLWITLRSLRRVD